MRLKLICILLLGVFVCYEMCDKEEQGYTSEAEASASVLNVARGVNVSVRSEIEYSDEIRLEDESK